MKQTFLTYLLLLVGAVAVAQSGKLTGIVSDSASKTPLESATVSLFNVADSSFVGYKISDKNGIFLFEKLPLKKKILVTVSYVGYTTYTTVTELKGNGIDTINISLSLNRRDSNAVVVTSTAPVRMNGDTLEINPSAFKLKPNAVAEELLNQVPGITIWSDGSITVNGRKVENVLVDGKPFLGMSDTRIATQNLPKTAIDKIQLYQEYDRTKIGNTQQPQDSLLTMNIKLKENSKTGYFGKAGAGYGTNDRFESDISFQMFNKKTSGGIGGGFNNINKNIGNLQEMFQNNTFSNINPNLYNVGRFGNSGVNKNHAIGAVFTHNFVETNNSRQNNRLTANYNKTGNNIFLTDLSLQNRTTLINPQFIRDEGVQNTRSDRHDFGFNYVKTNSYNDNLNVGGNAGFNNETGITARLTEVRDGANALQNTNSSNAIYKRRSDNQSVNINYAKSDNEEPLKNFNIRVNAGRSNSSSERNVNSTFDSYTDNSKDTTYNRRYNTNNDAINLGAYADYGGFKRLIAGRHNLFGINLRFTQTFNYTRTSDNTAVSDFDITAKQYIDNNKISNRNKREYMEYVPSIAVSKSFFKWTDKYSRNFNADLRIVNDFKTEKNASSIAQRNVNRSFHFVRYGANANYWYQKREKYQISTGLNYDKRIDYPTIDNLYTIVDDINAYDIRIGNPRLRNRTDHSFNMNTSFNTLDPKLLYTVHANFNAGYTRSLNPVTDSIINEISGKRTSYYINADKRSNVFLNYNFNIARKLKKSNLQLQYSGNYNTGKFPNYIDGAYTVSQTRSFSNQIGLQFSLRTVMILNLSKTLQQYSTKQSAVGLRSFNNTNDITRFGITLNYPKNFAFSSTLDNVDNSNLSKPTVLWNAFLTYRCMQQQGELKLSAMDILKQYQNITNSANAYGTSTRITNGLQQYFLLTFSYYPRKFSKTQGRGEQGVRIMDRIN